ncbi:MULTISPECIES: hypothetical protein [unclassified Micromonospora]|uniref:hypothetical protein n=1 Tax=unclassified Micromonospora TaxID=2617518 RepID=UPI00331A1FF2
MELRITAARDGGVRVVRSVPIADEVEEAAARQWMAESDPRWSTLDGGLRREIVPAGGER